MTQIQGHDDAINSFIAAMHGERLHHAWLLTGPKGIGKTSLARQMAARLLAVAMDKEGLGQGLAVPEAHMVAKLMAAGSHPDFRFLERLPREEKLREKPKADWGDAELARNISVEQVRRLNASMATAPSLSRRRVIIVDSIDDMERGAANALLKTLEEPPTGTLFLLISHAPGRLLPTIRSRCRTLRFSALSDDCMTSVLRGLMPDLDPVALALLVSTSEGAPGRALDQAALDTASIDAAIQAIAARGDRDNAQRSALAKALAPKGAVDRYRYFLDRAPRFMALHARTQSGDALAIALDQWQAAHDLAQAALPTSLDPQSVVFALSGHLAALAPAR